MSYLRGCHWSNPFLRKAAHADSKTCWRQHFVRFVLQIGECDRKLSKDPVNGP